VIVDPPRDWLHKNLISFLWELKKELDFKLLYISCNPITMARDIQLLVENWFKINKLQPVDMFPQTHHIEVIWILY
jgi:23S rRNA (uracil1939-C5)-methyltransferase